MYVKLPTPKTTTYMQGDNTQVGLIRASKLSTHIGKNVFNIDKQMGGWT